MKRTLKIAMSGLLGAVMFHGPMANASAVSRALSQDTIDKICRLAVRGGFNISPDGELNIYDTIEKDRNKILEVLPILQAEIGETGLEVGAGFRVQRGKNKGVSTRTESYLLGAKVGYNDRIAKSGDAEFFLGGQLRGDFQVAFTRQFTDQKDSAGNVIRDGACDALDITRDTPYFVTEMPIKAMSGKSPSATVVQELKVGDMVSMRSRMTLVLSATVASDLGLVGSVGVAVAAGASVAVRGQYDVHVLKVDATKVHLRVMGLSEDSTNVEVAVVAPGSNFLKLAGLETGVGLIDDAIVDSIQFKVVRLNLSTNAREYGLLDYTADLSDAAAAAAFDKTLGVTRIIDRAKRGMIGAITGSSTKVTVNTQDLEKIYQADMNASYKRVTRNLRVTANEKGTSGGFDVDLLLFSFNTSGFYGQTKMTVVDGDNTQTNSILRARESRSEFSFLFGLMRGYTSRSIEMVSSTDADFKNMKAQNMMISYERQYNSLSSSDLANFRRQLLRTVPASLAGQIDYSPVRYGQSDAVARFSVVMDAKIITQIMVAPKVRPTEAANMYASYLLKNADLMSRDLLSAKSEASPSRFCRGDGPGSPCRRAVGRYEGEILNAASHLAVMMSSDNSESQRIHAMMELRSNNLFAATGAGFMLSLVEQGVGPSVLADNVHVAVELPGVVMQRVGGGNGIGREFTQALYVQSILRDSKSDLSMEAEMIALGMQP